MSYNKQTWVDDSTPLSAQRLNNMEDGIATADTTATKAATVIPESVLNGISSTMTTPIIHAGTFVTTPDASGNFTYVFVPPFPNGVASVMACPGDLTSSFGQVVVSGVTKTSFNIQAHTFTGGAISTVIRVNFIAIGW